MGGRGASSGIKRTIGLYSGGTYGNSHTKYLDPGKFQNQMTQKSQQAGIDTFIKQYGNENKEFYVAINKKGTVMQFNSGGVHSVGARFRDNNGKYFQADKGSQDIHNHPSGLAIPSVADLTSFSKTKEISASHIIGKGGEYFKITKGNNFRSKGFVETITNNQKTMTLEKFVLNIKNNQSKFGYKVEGTHFKK